MYPGGPPPAWQPGPPQGTLAQSAHPPGPPGQQNPQAPFPQPSRAMQVPPPMGQFRGPPPPPTAPLSTAPPPLSAASADVTPIGPPPLLSGPPHLSGPPRPFVAAGAASAYVSYPAPPTGQVPPTQPPPGTVPPYPTPVQHGLRPPGGTYPVQPPQGARAPFPPQAFPPPAGPAFQQSHPTAPPFLSRPPAFSAPPPPSSYTTSPPLGPAAPPPFSIPHPPSATGLPPPSLSQPPSSPAFLPQQPPPPPMGGPSSASPPPPPSGPQQYQQQQPQYPQQQQQQYPQQQQQPLVEEFKSLAISAPGPGSVAGGTGAGAGTVDPGALPRPVDSPLFPSLPAPSPYFPANAPTRFLRFTTNAIPSSQSLRSRWHLPLGATVHPLAPCPPGEEVPVVSFGPSGIVRCRRCRTYINPFSPFTDGGRRWRCNVCGLLNDVAQDYFCQLDGSGRRLDLSTRPELRQGSVEFLAPAEYMVRPPMPPIYFFLIDVSAPTTQSGMLQVLSDTVKACLDSLPGDSRTRVGFLAFHSSLHFFLLKPFQQQPQMLVVSDTEDPFLPAHDDLLVNLTESRAAVDALLEALPTMFQAAGTGGGSIESATGPALQAMMLLMAQLGGKVLLFQSSLPSLGVGRLRLRGDDPRVYGSDREHVLRGPEEAFYKSMAAEFAKSQISVDVFSFAGTYADVASLGSMSRYTGGQVFYYPSFHISRDGDKFSRELARALTRETGWEAVMRIRCSKGLKISAFHGHFFVRSLDLLALPSVDCDKSYAIQIAHDESVLAANASVFFQVALLYTSSCGERRIRVHTSALPTVSDLAEVYRAADVGATINVLGKIAIEKSLTSRLEDCRQMINARCVATLKEYRSLFPQQQLMARHMAPPAPGAYTSPSAAGSSSSGRLIYPPTLHLLPILCLGLLKSPALRGGFQEITPDARSAAGYEMMCMDVDRLGLLLYPRLFRVDNLGEQKEEGKGEERGAVDGEQHAEESGNAASGPAALPLVTSVLDSRGAYLLDDGLSMILWLGGALPQEVAQQIVGPEAASSTDIHRLPFIPVEGSNLSKRIDQIMEFLRKSSPVHQQVSLVRQGGPGELGFYHAFTEDRSGAGMSYIDFILYLHRHVQKK